MPPRDSVLPAVRTTIEREGGVITADPLVLPVGLHNLYVDLAAERVVAAQRGEEQIAVEIKSFRGRSEVADLEQALGQFVLYRGILHRSEPKRQMVLAVPRATWGSLFESELGRTAREELSLVVVVFDPVREEVWQWFR